jgi:hypothetical protein
MIDKSNFIKIEINEENNAYANKNIKKCVHNIAEPGATSLSTEHRHIIDVLLDRPTTDGKYEASIPSEPIVLQIDKSDLDHMFELFIKSKSKANFSSETPTKHKRNLEWINIFEKYISRINETCVFMYKDHHFSDSKSIKVPGKKEFLISADAECKFMSCSCSFHAIIYGNGELITTFDGAISHSPSEYRSRPMRRTNRLSIAEKLTSGIMPDQLRLKELGRLTDNNRKFGNYNLVGSSPHVFRKIRSEANTSLMLDQELSISLEKIKAEQATKINSDKTIPGYLQTISISPMRLILFTEGGLILWKKFADRVPVSWDATGGIVMSRGKRVFYYELTIASISIPSITTKDSSGPSFPVTSMLSDSHSTFDLVQWLQDFERAYRKLHGYKSSFPRPPMVHSDGALVFQMAALRFFNGDLTFSTYLKRCWTVVNRKATKEDLEKTIIHSCLSHFVKNLKHQAAKHYPKQKVNIISFILYIYICCNYF